LAKSAAEKIPRPAAPIIPLSARGKKFLASGVLLVALGFWILTYTDPGGQNWASTLSPALLVAGYVLIGIGLIVPIPPPPQEGAFRRVF
jgi:hypothetical protein